MVSLRCQQVLSKKLELDVKVTICIWIRHTHLVDMNVTIVSGILHVKSSSISDDDLGFSKSFFCNKKDEEETHTIYYT